jgi:hypothetical protein
VKIKWVYQDEAGYWDSFEGRFSVSPVFIGRVTIQGYELRDDLRTHPRKTAVGAKETYDSHIYPSLWTVKEAKAKAEEILRAERQRK